MDDKITNALQNLSGSLPSCQQLGESEKDALIAALGYRTTCQILKAKKTLPLSRIPFLFSSLDTQLVVNALGNDLNDALKRAQTKKSLSPKQRK